MLPILHREGLWHAGRDIYFFTSLCPSPLPLICPTNLEVPGFRGNPQVVADVGWGRGEGGHSLHTRTCTYTHRGFHSSTCYRQALMSAPAWESVPGWQQPHTCRSKCALQLPWALSEP